MAARIEQARITALAPPSAKATSHRDAMRLACDAMLAIADAASNGEAAVKTAAAAGFASFAEGGEARLVERAGRHWRYSGEADDVPPALARMLDDVSSPAEITRAHGAGTLVPLSPGSSGVLLSTAVPQEHWPALRMLAAGVELALAAATQSRGKLDALEEIRGLQQIALRILSAGDLDDILFAISQETKRLLSADICGVFLREGEQLVMRDCVGNLTRNIARIRLHRGQGLAGRVFETGLHCVVSDYLSSDAVSQEYAELVRAERIRSALGVPLRVNDQLIGVLEVWRRRRSTFSDADVRRLLALSTLTAIAINNAKLYESQKSAVEQLTLANHKLTQQNDAIRQSAEITGALIQSLLDRGGLAAIARIVARHAGAEAAFLSGDLQPMSGFAAAAWCESRLPQIRRAIDEAALPQGGGTITLRVDDHWLSVRAVIASREQVGWICLLGRAEPDHLHEITIGQAAMATALIHLEQRAAAQARAETIGGVMWDLLEGREQPRRAAASRAGELQIDLGGPLRIVHLAVAGPDDAEGSTERRWRQVHESVERALDRSGMLRLIGARGSLLVAVVSACESGPLKAMLKSVDQAVGREVEAMRTFWGASAACAGAAQLHAAHREAAAAIRLVKQLGPGQSVAIHDELGMIGLLLKVRSDGDLGAFVAETLGKVMTHDARHHGVLAKTVRAWFECDCAQQATARKLYVHDKTVRYRLSQFEALSGLDLNRHADRMLVDIALSMHSIARDAGDEDQPDV